MTIGKATRLETDEKRNARAQSIAGELIAAMRADGDDWATIEAAEADLIAAVTAELRFFDQQGDDDDGE